MKKADIGIIGLGVMGQNLALNIERHGFSVAGYRRDREKLQEFLSTEAAGKQIIGVDSLPALASALETPRRILLMVPAGAATDDAIQQLKPSLQPGDILIDGGNAFFVDTEKRYHELMDEGIHYLGMGVSGGEEGALWGPSIMPGGSLVGWKAVAPIFEAIAAKADDGSPCVTYIGPRGAGHYVKMVHNGIEYADMQLICEMYDLLRRGFRLSPPELAQIFADWNTGELQSYLIEITASILQKIDPLTGLPLVDVILDQAQQKGTGKWTSQNALDVGAPIPTINAAVEMRILSALKDQRVKASHILGGHIPEPENLPAVRQSIIEAARDALYASKIISYAQGMYLLRMASIEYEYSLDLSEIARIWRAGCIIRAALLNDISSAFKHQPALHNLILEPTFMHAVQDRLGPWREVLHQGIRLGIPMPALYASLAYYDAYRSQRLPAYLLQAQRDYFGAHTYRRIDREGNFHTDWEE